MRFSLSFIPKENKFFFMLHQSTVNIQDVARRLLDLMTDFDDNVEGKVREIKEKEEFGDMIIHDITRALHRTFVTPIDREDILMLAGRLDDVVDAMFAAAGSNEAAGTVFNIAGGESWQLTGKRYVEDFYSFLGAPSDDANYRTSPG